MCIFGDLLCILNLITLYEGHIGCQRPAVLLLSKFLSPERFDPKRIFVVCRHPYLFVHGKWMRSIHAAPLTVVTNIMNSN